MDDVAPARDERGQDPVAVAFLVPRGDNEAIWTDGDTPATTAPSPSTPGTTVTPDGTTSTTGTSPATDSVDATSAPLPSSSTTSSTSSSTTPSATSSTEAPPLPDFPPQVLDYQNGDQAWGLYLAIEREGEDRSAEIAAANAAALEVGYHPSSGGNGAPPLGCDRGALEAFGLEGTQPYAVGVYFTTQARADEARAAFRARGVPSDGIAFVTIDCRD